MEKRGFKQYVSILTDNKKEINNSNTFIKYLSNKVDRGKKENIQNSSSETFIIVEDKKYLTKISILFLRIK